jgi:hypothetical protein
METILNLQQVSCTWMLATVGSPVQISTLYYITLQYWLLLVGPSILQYMLCWLLSTPVLTPVHVVLALFEGLSTPVLTPVHVVLALGRLHQYLEYVEFDTPRFTCRKWKTCRVPTHWHIWGWFLFTKWRSANWHKNTMCSSIWMNRISN